MFMRNKLFVSMFAAAALGAASASAHAASSPLSATLYGDLAASFVYSGDAGKDASGNKVYSTYGLYDNVSLLGVKGDAAIDGGTKFIYDFNAGYDMTQGTPGPFYTHLAIVGIDSPYGTVTLGRDNGLYNQMVDGSTYVTNWYLPVGMSSLQVDQSIKYVSPSFSGFSFGGQAYDMGKSSTTDVSTTNYTAAAQYTLAGFTAALGYTEYAKGAPIAFGGVDLKSKVGGSVAYSGGPFTAVAAVSARKPVSTAANTKDILNALLSGSYALNSTVSLIGNISSTSQASDGSASKVQGTIVTLEAAYAPYANVLYSVEVQSADKKANESGLASGTSSDKSNVGFALSATYSF